MGGEQSTDRSLSDYQNSERIGIFRQLEEQGRNLVEIARQLPSEQNFKEWEEGLTQLKSKIEANEVVYMPVKYVYKQTGLCGSGGTLYIIFDRWESFLKDEIISRRKNQHFYTEEEIWFILYTLVKLGKIYEPMRIKIGDLHSNNIVVTPEGFLRVITRHSLPLQLTNFEKIVEEIKTDVYLAPEEMDAQMIERGVYEVKMPARADTFSLGIIMLEVATLQNCSYLYIRNPLRISNQKFSVYTKILKDKYSILLFKTIMSTLQPNPNVRNTMSNIYEMLKPYQMQIQEMKPFNFMQSPGKEVMNESHDNSMIPEGSINNSRAQKKGKQSSVPFSPPTQTLFSFTNKNI